jgi:UDP-N-acetylglucosamine--N-acetylmuramyl-(pentapeptide) pyrophosphoryl-undecaprenol N-acetylglucosamine transferase
VSVVFAGGGTGGHLYPAIAIADELKGKRPGAEITFVGTAGRIEERVIPATGYHFTTIWISGFRRRLGWPLLLFPLKVVVSVVQSILLLRRLRPQVVVGTGGYVSGPPVFAAWLLGIPSLLQEQNSYPGVTTRLLARRAREVHLTFEASRRFLNRSDNVYVSGNPVRAAVGSVRRPEAARFFGLDPSVTTVLVFGGSLGASAINEALRRNLAELVARRLQVIWQTGPADADPVLRAVRNEGAEGAIRVFPYVERMEYAYAASDLAVCRAGATTVAELAQAGLPAVLIPYPHAAADHQTENARAMEAAGAALLCPDAEAGERLLPLLAELLENPPRLHAMAGKARAMARPDAASLLADAVLRLAN